MLFAGLLETLRRRGYTITVEHELRLQRLLPHLDASCLGAKELGDLLCPLFAASKEQQEEFGPIFEEWLRRAGFQPPLKQVKTEPKIPPPPPPWYTRRVVYVALALLLLVGAVWRASGRPSKEIEIVQKPPVTEVKPEVIETPEGPRQQIVVIVKRYEPPPDRIRTWVRYRTLAESAAASILLSWLLFEIWRYQRRRMILQRDRAERQTAPHQLALNIAPRQAGTAQDAALAEAARRMRVRERSERYTNDLPATIREAVRRAGFLPGFLVRQQTREPAYLMLIDRRSLRDHQMLLFEEYARALRQRNVDVTVIHFEGDPRYPVEMDWGRVKTLHSAARLLLAADGESLRHPQTGELFGWVAEEFAEWTQRAILTPIEPGAWGWREKVLAGVFTVWPATGAGLLGLSRLWNGERVAGATKESIAGRWLPPQRWREVSEEAVGQLRADLGEAGFRWLCACAHAPELQWDITLRLAELPEVGASSARDQWRLFKLDWFRQGFIPRDWCYRLAGEYPAGGIQKALVGMFQEAPEGSDASQLPRLWLQFQRFWPDRETLRGWWLLRRWARGMSAETLERDVVVMRSLDSLRRSPIDLILGERLSRALHESGVSLLGLRTVFRFAAVVVMAATVALAFFAVERQAAAFRPKEKEERKVFLLGDLNDVYFDEGDSSIRETARAVLTRIIKDFKPLFAKDPMIVLTAEGYASGTGLTNPIALELGDRRARAVRDFLVTQGLPGDRLKTISYGAERPVCTEFNEACRQRNDRVHLSFSGATQIEVRTPTSAGDILEQYSLIPKGTFQMGCSPGDSECQDDEEPAHTVTLSQDFYMAATEVTVANYAKFVTQTKRAVPEKSEYSKSDQDPVVNVSWDDAKAYCAFVSGRLPTEAEWEYGARGGSAAARYGPLDAVAWHSGNSSNQIHPVRQKQPNSYGLFDMLGNAFEWTNDWDGNYENVTVKDPKGPLQGAFRLVRGGCWYNYSRYSRASDRDSYLPGYRLNRIGFRCVRLAR